MREIKYHNGETINVDGIHFYGCSFVAGQELMDAEIPDPMNADVRTMAKQDRESTEDYYRRKLARELLFKKKQKLEKQLAWPQHFCSELKVRCYNHGSHGASMTEIKGWLLQDIVEKKIDKVKEAVFVGLTGFAREMIFTTKGSFNNRYGAATGKPRSLVIATDAERRGDPDLARKYMQIKCEYTHLWYFFQEIYNIINICRIHGLRLYMLPMLDPFSLGWYKKQYEIDLDQPAWVEQVRFIESEIDKYIIEHGKLDPLGGNIVERLPRGHPCAESHRKYGIKYGKKLLT